MLGLLVFPAFVDVGEYSTIVYISSRLFKKKIFLITQYTLFSLFSGLKQSYHDHLFNIYIKVFKSHVRGERDGNTIIHLKQ